MMTKLYLKKAISMVLTVCLVLSLAVGATAAGVSQFTDVRTNHWAYEEIADVVDKGIFLGTGAKTFGPEMDMTRSMFVTVLARLAGVKTDAYQVSAFRDVPTGTWYSGAVAWAAEKQIVKGVSDTMFLPEQVITREQMATMILRYTDYLKVKLPTPERQVRFADEAEISSFAADAVIACQRAGLLEGVGQNRFLPAGTATRCQVAALISRLAKLNGTIAYTVSFVTNATKTAAPQVVMNGKTASRPTGVTKSGYLLANWYSDEKLTQRYTFSTPVSSDLTLYAKWTRDSGGGYVVTYTAPAMPTPEDVEATLVGGDFQGIDLTYPAVTMNGGQIVLKGAYQVGTQFPGFGAGYNSGYVVPLKLSAPSSYSEGQTVKLEVTKGIGTTTIENVALDGQHYFYLLMYVPSVKPVDWAPEIRVTWGGTQVVYTLDVTGMAPVIATDAPVKGVTKTEADTLELANPGMNITPAQVSVTTTETVGTYNLYLSGGYVATNEYVVPIGFQAPKDFAGSAALRISGAGSNSDQSDTILTESSILYLLHIPTTLPTGWSPVITVTWTPTHVESNWFRSRAENPQVDTYRVDTTGMRSTVSLLPPTPATVAQMLAAYKVDGNRPFTGVELYTANLQFTNSVKNGSLTTFTIGGSYNPFRDGQTIPGFGVVPGDIGSGALILPLAFYTPTGLNLGALENDNTAMEYRFYLNNKTPEQLATIAFKEKTKANLSAENPFLFWLQVNESNLEALKTDGIRFDFKWYGGYTESFILKGSLTKNQTAATMPSIPGTELVKLETAKSDFAGIDPFLAAATAVKGEGGYALSGTYSPIAKGVNIPGFGTVGDEKTKLDKEFCLIPFSFTKPSNLRIDLLKAKDRVVTVNVTDKDGVVLKSRIIAKEDFDDKNGPFYTFFLQLNEPRMAQTDGKIVQFEFTWYDGTKETFLFTCGVFTPVENTAGKAYQLTNAEKVKLTTGQKDDPEQPLFNPLNGLKFNAMSISAFPTGTDQTALVLFGVSQKQNESQIKPYYGADYGDGYVFPFKFAKPAGTSITQVTQTITNGYTVGSQVKTTALGMDTAHTLILYVPALAPRADYAPALKLEWKNVDGKVIKTQTFTLDLTALKITPYTPPEPVAPVPDTEKHT